MVCIAHIDRNLHIVSEYDHLAISIGYLCATAAADGFVRIWDLRKLKPSKLLDFSSNAHAVTAASFDYSGTYLAYTSGKSNQNFSIDICVVKEYSNILQVTYSRVVTHIDTHDFMHCPRSLHLWIT